MQLVRILTHIFFYVVDGGGCRHLLRQHELLRGPGPHQGRAQARHFQKLQETGREMASRYVQVLLVQDYSHLIQYHLVCYVDFERYVYDTGGPFSA